MVYEAPPPPPRALAGRPPLRRVGFCSFALARAARGGLSGGVVRPWVVTSGPPLYSCVNASAGAVNGQGGFQHTASPRSGIVEPRKRRGDSVGDVAARADVGLGGRRHGSLMIITTGSIKIHFRHESSVLPRLRKRGDWWW